MSWQLVQLHDMPQNPWRNGGGVTRELVAWPGADDWIWRMSVAEVAQSGPFSRFEGVQRWFAVLAGAGVRLERATDTGQLTDELTLTSAPFGFAGEQPVNCTLINGATQDFNLMLRREHASAFMQRVNGKLHSILDATKIIAVYAIETGARVHIDARTLSLPADTLAWQRCAGGSVVQVESNNALWMEIAL